MVEYSDGLDEVAHSIAHRGRRAIVATLSGGAASSSQLAQLLGIGLPALHKHLQLLRAAAPIASAKSGRTDSHTIRRDGLDSLADWIATRKLFWDNQFDALADHVEDS